MKLNTLISFRSKYIVNTNINLFKYVNFILVYSLNNQNNHLLGFYFDYNMQFPFYS